MAKRKKLNKRVAILLGVMGGVLIALVLTVGIRSNLWDRFFPKDPELFLKRAEAALKEKRHVESDRAFKDAIGAGIHSDSPRLKEYYLAYAKMCHKWFQSGTGLTRTQRNERFGMAIGQCRKALRRDPAYVEARQYLCELYWEIAQVNSMGDNETAIAQSWTDYINEVDKLLKLTPKDHRAHYRRGVAKGALSQNIEGQIAEAALADMNEAIQLKEDEPSYWLGMIRFLRRLKTREAQVDETYQRAIEANPDDATALISYANYLRQNSDLEGARQRLAEAVRVDPVQGNLAMSELLIRQASKHEPGASKAERDKHRQEKLGDALAAAGRARQADPEDARSYVLESNIHSLLNNSSQAVAILKEGVKAIEAVAATQPAGTVSRRLAISRVELYYRLTNVLLDLAEATKAADRQPVMDEVRQYMAKMLALDLSGPHRAKIDGRIALLDGRVDEGMTHLEESYATSRGLDLKVANLLIGIYLSRRLPGKAEEILDRVLRMPGQRGNVSALLAKARLRMGYRDYARAEPYIRRTLQSDPNNAEALNMKLLVEAIGSDTLPPLPPGWQPNANTVQLMLQRAMVLWMDGQRDEAIAYVEELHDRIPDSKAVVARLSYLYRAAERIDDAEKLLKDAIRRDPDDKAMQGRLALLRETDQGKQREILMKIADELPPLRRELEKATIWATYGDEAKYLQHVRAAAKIDPDASAVVERLFRHALRTKDWDLASDQAERARKGNLDGCEGQLFDARMTLARGQLDVGIAKLLDVLKRRPNRKDIHGLLGEAYLTKKLYDPAYESYKAAAEIDPAYSRAIVGLAVVSAAQGKMEEHRRYILRAYQLVPHNAYVRERAMAMQDEVANPQDLIKRRERTRQQRPDDMANVLGLGILYERTGQPDKAEEMYVLFNDKEADKLRGARVLGGFYLRRGKLKDMERVVKPLMDTHEDMVGARILYGQMLIAVDPAKARLQFEQAVATKVDDPRGHLALARLAALLKEWPKAVDSMTKYVSLRPDNRGRLKELVRYGIEAGEYPLAMERLNKILEGDPSDATATTLKGVVFLRQSKLQEALALFTQAIQARPNYAEPRVYRAQLYLTQGDATKAKADLQVAKRLSDRVDVSMQLAMIYEGLRDYDSAEMAYREIRAERKVYQPAIDRLIMIYRRRHKWRELEELLSEVKQIFPNSSKYLLAEEAMWEARGDEPKRLAALDKALKADPRSILTLRTYLLALQEAGRFSELISVSDPYIDNPTVSAWVSAIRGAALAKLEQDDLADKFFLRCFQSIGADYSLLAVAQTQKAYGKEGAKVKAAQWLKARPQNWRLHLLLGVLHSETDSLPEALSALNDALARAGEPLAKFLANRHIGSVHYRMKNYRETEKAYLECLLVRPTDVQVLNNLAYLYTNDMGQPKKALPYAKKAVTLSPGNAKILDTYGWTLAKMNKLSDAEGILVKTTGVDEPLAASRYHLGWVYEKQGRLPEAFKQYRQGFEMLRTQTNEPLHDVLKEALARVDGKLKPGSTKP